MAKLVSNKMELTIFQKERTNAKGKKFASYFATKNNGDNFYFDGCDCGSTVNIKFWDVVEDKLNEHFGDGMEFPVGVVVSIDELYAKKKFADNAMGVTCTYYTIYIKDILEITEPVIKQVEIA